MSRTLTRLYEEEGRRVKCRWVLRGGGGIGEAAKIVPRQGDDLALLLPTNRKFARIKVYPMNSQKHFLRNIRVFCRVAICLHFLEVSVLSSLEFLERSHSVHDVFSQRHPP